MHERALTSPAQWAALSERILALQGDLSTHAATTHLEATAAVMTTTFRVDTRRVVGQRNAPRADVRRLTGHGILASSGVRETIWLLRHVRAFAESFPQELLTVGRSTEQSPQLAAPKQLRSLWQVRLKDSRFLCSHKRPLHHEG